MILHSFAGSRTVFDVGMDVGAYFSFSGMITFKNWNPGVRLSDCPPDRLLVETDAPYLAPVPHRGRRNEPAFVRAVVERAAAERGVAPDDLAERTSTNARRCFGPRLEAAL